MHTPDLHLPNLQGHKEMKTPIRLHVGTQPGRAWPHSTQHAGPERTLVPVARTPTKKRPWAHSRTVRTQTGPQDTMAECGICPNRLTGPLVGPVQSMGATRCAWADRGRPVLLTRSSNTHHHFHSSSASCTTGHEASSLPREDGTSWGTRGGRLLEALDRCTSFVGTGRTREWRQLASRSCKAGRCGG